MKCFVYGTLTAPATADKLLESWHYDGEATLVGLHRVDGEYPTLVPGGTVTGRILVTDDPETLDRYEGVDRGLYVRVTVPHESGDTVETYIGNPERLGVETVETPWPDKGSFAQRVENYLTDNEIVVRDQNSDSLSP